MGIPEEIPFEDALLSWFENVYLPVIRTIEQNHILRLFKGRTHSDLYIYVIKYWDELKQKFGNDFSLDEAVKNFKKENSARTFFGKIKNLFEKKQLQK